MREPTHGSDLKQCCIPCNHPFLLIMLKAQFWIVVAILAMILINEQVVVKQPDVVVGTCNTTVFACPVRSPLAPTIFAVQIVWFLPILLFVLMYLVAHIVNNTAEFGIIDRLRMASHWMRSRGINFNPGEEFPAYRCHRCLSIGLFALMVLTALCWLAFIGFFAYDTWYSLAGSWPALRYILLLAFILSIVGEGLAVLSSFLAGVVAFDSYSPMQTFAAGSYDGQTVVSELAEALDYVHNTLNIDIGVDDFSGGQESIAAKINIGMQPKEDDE